MKSLKSALLVCACAALAACSDGPAPVANRPAVRPAPVVKPAAADTEAKAIEATIVYQYNPIKRDPFRVPDEMRGLRGNDGRDSPCNDPLCQWDLDQLALVAVVTGDSNPIAMVEDPQGRGYIVKRQSRIGRQGGKVTSILRDSITVTEYWAQPNGESKPLPRSLGISGDKNVLPSMDLATGQVYQ